jgi:hypothetical protein
VVQAPLLPHAMSTVLEGKENVLLTPSLETAAVVVVPGAKNRWPQQAMSNLFSWPNRASQKRLLDSNTVERQRQSNTQLGVLNTVPLTAYIRHTEPQMLSSRQRVQAPRKEKDITRAMSTVLMS